MRKLIIVGLTLLGTISAFANMKVLTIPQSLNSEVSQRTMDIEKIQSLINEAGELAAVECEKRDAQSLDEIAAEIGSLIRPHAGHDQFQIALVAQQRIQHKSVKALLCQQ